MINRKKGNKKMERYFYHGIGDDIACLWKMLEIINSGGLKTRSQAGNYDDQKYNHVCLYKKNEEFDYNGKEMILSSARAGWIDKCWFFIISPDVPAKKVSVSNETGFDEFGNPTSNLVDEWRSESDIPLDKIVGIGIPFDYIAQEEKEFGFAIDMDSQEHSFKEYYQLLKSLLEYANNFNWIVVNSEEKDICDKLDEQLNNRNIKL